MSTFVKIKPLGNRVLVKRSEAKTSKGGIILPDSAKRSQRGRSHGRRSWHGG